MRKVQRWRYYCEFCGKGGGSSYHMQQHENHCTKNPNRQCRMCHHQGEEPQPIADLLSALGKGDEDGMKRLRELAVDCPSCMLAAIRQSGLMCYDYDPDPEGYSVKPVDLGENNWTLFDFKAEKERFWKQVNSLKWEGVAMEGCY